MKVKQKVQRHPYFYRHNQGEDTEWYWAWLPPETTQEQAIDRGYAPETERHGPFTNIQEALLDWKKAMDSSSKDKDMEHSSKDTDYWKYRNS